MNPESAAQTPAAPSNVGLPNAESPKPPSPKTGFSLNNYRSDIIAGLSLVGLLVPEAVAYADIAGLPARAGLIGLLAGLACYGLIGKSRFAIVAGTSSSAVVMLTALASLLPVTLADKLALASVIVLGTGVLFLLAGLFKLGEVANFIAKPVLRGITIGLAITIIISQLPKVLAIKITASTLVGKISQIFYLYPSWHLPSLLMGGGALGVLFLWKSKRQPVALWVVLVKIVLVQFTVIGQLGIGTVGEVSLTPTARNWSNMVQQEWSQLLQFSLALALVLYAESYSAIRSFAIKYNDPTDNNRDLLALGTANVLSGALAGLPIGAGFSATSANETAGATSKIAAYVALAGVGVVIATCLPYLGLLPEPVLAAIVIHAVSHGLSWQPVSRYFAWRRDRSIVVVTVGAVLLLGVLNGLLAAVVYSIILTLHNLAKSKWAELGRLDGGHNFVSRKHFKTAQTVPDLFIANIGQPLFFANAEPILEEIRQTVTHMAVKAVILSLEESPDVDGTTIEALDTVSQQLARQGILLYLCRLHSRPRHILKAAQLAYLPKQNLSKLSVDDAVTAVQTQLAGKPTDKKASQG